MYELCEHGASLLPAVVEGACFGAVGINHTPAVRPLMRTRSVRLLGHDHDAGVGRRYEIGLAYPLLRKWDVSKRITAGLCLIYGQDRGEAMTAGC